MNVRYRVELSQAERDELTALLSGGKHAVRKLKRAQILLAAATGAGDGEIARSVGVGGSTVYRTKRRFVLGNDVSQHAVRLEHVTHNVRYNFHPGEASARIGNTGSAFSVENLYRPPIECIGTFWRSAYANNSELAKFGQRPNQMESNPLACRGVEMQAVHDGDVDQIVWGEAPISLRFKVIGCAIMTRVAGRCQKLARFDIIAAVGQVLEHEERMGGAAFPEIDLDCQVLPSLCVFH